MSIYIANSPLSAYKIPVGKLAVLVIYESAQMRVEIGRYAH